MNPLRSLAEATLAASLLALAACGGGSDSATSEPGDVVASTSQTLDSAGGTVTLRELSLTLPAAALTESVALGLQREAVAGPALARFRFSPAGTALAAPAELQFSAAGLSANARFFWEVDGELWMIPGTVSAGVLTSRIRSLGFDAAGTVPRALAALQPGRERFAAARERTLADGAGQGGGVVVQPADCEAHIFALKSRLVRAANQGDESRAIAIFDDLQATLDVCAAASLQALEQSSCDALAVAQANAQVLLANDLKTFRSLTVPLFATQAFVQQTEATCGNADPAANAALIDAKFDQLLDVMKGQMARAEFTDALTARDIKAVLELEITCQALDLGQVCNRLDNELYPDLLDALRASAFEECRVNGTPLAVSQFHALGSQTGDADRFLGHGRFSLAAVEADLSFCGDPSLGLRVFDGAAVPSELADRATTVRPLRALGDYPNGGTITVPRDGSLNIAGSVGVLRCADGSASGAELVLRIDGREWKRRAATGNAFPLDSAPLLLDLPKDLPGLGIDPANRAGFNLMVSREGGACSDGQHEVLNTPFTLFDVKVNLDGNVSDVLVGRVDLALGEAHPGAADLRIRVEPGGGDFTVLSATGSMTVVDNGLAQQVSCPGGLTRIVLRTLAEAEVGSASFNGSGFLLSGRLVTHKDELNPDCSITTRTTVSDNAALIQLPLVEIERDAQNRVLALVLQDRLGRNVRMVPQ